MRLTRQRAARAAATALVAALVLAACGADTETPIETGPEKHRWWRPPPQ